jgi:EAL domain-containing protein (putative c-di-GMP-specific phosphodiesterase class I)/CheY-like chemotaxis protein
MDVGGATLHALLFLVAEADPAERGALGAALMQAGATRVTEVRDGPAALHTLQAGFAPRVDVAIVDLDLPGMDGLALLRALAAAESVVRVIVVGAQPPGVLFSIESLAAALGVALLGTLPRPVTAAGLAMLLGHYRPQRPAAPAPPVPHFALEEVGTGLRERQFEPYFQPQIALATGQVTRLEAFARWRHPVHGLLAPPAFMAALAEQGRIDFLDWTMLDMSVEHVRRFRDQGMPVPVSLNLAPATLAQPDFVKQVSTVLARHGVPPASLTFEMTESSILDFDVDFIERLVRLRMLGFGLAVDDYGTARSNLQLLARIPFTELKIDRAFVDGASKSRPLGTVLKSFLGLAHSLDRMSVAVGVETRQDWDFLQGLGCTYAQGYHIANPMAAQAFPRWIEEWRQFF